MLFIAVDDLNDWVGPLKGYPGVKTPNIDRLAKKGMTFKKAYCSAPACNPSRASLLTGVRPSTSGVYHNSQPWRNVLPDVVTLPQYFTANGYKVMGAGKIFHEPFEDSVSWPVKYEVPEFPKPEKVPVNGGANFDWSPVNATDEEMGDHKTVQRGIDFLQQHHDKPFFLAIGLIRPHLPWYAPQKYFDMYPLEKVMLPKVKPNDLDDLPPMGKIMANTIYGTVEVRKGLNDHQFILENNQWKKAIQGYLASISFADAQIGRLLDALEKSNYNKNTIIIFFGDHGWHLGEKEHWRKFSLWEESARVPFFVVIPGLTKPASVCERTVNLMDIYPTLVSLCEFPKKPGLEANDITPLLKNPKLAWNHPSLTTHGKNNHAVRTERWRYISYNDGGE
ncbi:MAG TPA: sulfatase, partial [Chitinophagaceae bacterium]|nr:sulfatase [Chitinophagaceae bacterium]